MSGPEPADDLHPSPLESPPMTNDAPSVLNDLNPAFMAGLLSGFIAGIDRGRELADTEAVVLHRRAYSIVHAHASIAAHDLHHAAIRARQVASWERQKRAAAPWPQETAPGDPGPWPPMRYLRPAP